MKPVHQLHLEPYSAETFHKLRISLSGEFHCSRSQLHTDKVEQKTEGTPTTNYRKFSGAQNLSPLKYLRCTSRTFT